MHKQVPGENKILEGNQIDIKKKPIWDILGLSLKIIIGFILIFHLSSLHNEVDKKDKIIQEQAETISSQEILIKDYNISEASMLDCPFCLEMVHILPVNTSYYIECPSCGLQSDYFDSKAALIEYWNTRPQDD